MKIFKQNICNNIIFITIIMILLTLSIIFESIISVRDASTNISEFQLVYNNLSMSKQWIYVSLCTVIILKSISFSENYIYILRLGSKRKLWNLIMLHILIINLFISMYIVSISYILGILFTKHIIVGFNTTVILLFLSIILNTIGLSIFNIITIIFKMITNSKEVSYLILIIILVVEALVGGKFLFLQSMSFNIEYVDNLIVPFLNAVRLGGICILFFELGEFLYIKKDIYILKHNVNNCSFKYK